MRIAAEDLVTEFYNKNPELFKDISEKQAKEVCYAPWRYLKQEMETGNLAEVRFKYFGNFVVFPGRVKHLLSDLEKRFLNKQLAEKVYNKYAPRLKKFLENESKN